MKLNEVAFPEGMYKAKIVFISRGNTRKGQWSTKQVRSRLESNGYSMEPDDNQHPMVKTPLIYKVVLSGTKDEVIEDRRNITRILQITSSGVIKSRFEILERPTD